VRALLFFRHCLIGFGHSGSMSKLTFSGCYGDNEEGDPFEEGEAVTIDTTMTEADFSGKKLGVSGAMIVSAFIPKW
jgi:hypothetical protein